MTTSFSSPPLLRVAIIDDSPLRGHGTLFVHLLKDRTLTHGVTPIGYHCINDTSDARPWCSDLQIPWIEDCRHFDGKIDAVVIPAASTPESHQQLVRLAAPLGVPIYLDKPLAPTRQEGEAIYDIARQHNVPLMSASALRFSNELQTLRSAAPVPDYVQIWAGWQKQFDEFFIHPAELFCALSSRPYTTIERHSSEAGIVRYEFKHGRESLGTIQLHDGEQGFAIAVSDASGWHYAKINSPFFIATIEAVIAFFRSGRSAISEASTLQVLNTIDLCRKANLSRSPFAASLS